MKKAIWDSVDAVRDAIVAGTASSYATQRMFVLDNEAHVGTLLALSVDELTQLIPPTKGRQLSDHRIVGIMSQLAYQRSLASDFEAAWRLYDAATTVPNHVDAMLYVNALWALLDDNHHRGVMTERSAVYLPRCLPHGPRKPAVFYNAACLCHELGDDEKALAYVRDAIRFGYDQLEQMRNDTGFGELRHDSRFIASFSDPDLIAAQRERVLPKALVALKATEGSWDEMDFELYAHLESETETLEWLVPWTGNDKPPSSVLRIFGQDGAGGKVGFFRPSTAGPIEDDAVVYLGSEGELDVIARDLADFFVLVAANLGPMDVRELGDAPPPGGLRGLPKVAALLKKHFPQAHPRSVSEALAARKDAAASFVELFRKAIR